MVHELTAQHELIVVEVDLATRKLKRAIGSKRASKINKITHELRISSLKAGDMKDSKMKEFVDLIHDLYSKVESNVYEIMKDQL